MVESSIRRLFDCARGPGPLPGCATLRCNLCTSLGFLLAVPLVLRGRARGRAVSTGRAGGLSRSLAGPVPHRVRTGPDWIGYLAGGLDALEPMIGADGRLDELDSRKLILWWIHHRT